jgi:hypothetical protein
MASSCAGWGAEYDDPEGGAPFPDDDDAGRTGEATGAAVDGARGEEAEGEG